MLRRAPVFNRTDTRFPDTPLVRFALIIHDDAGAGYGWGVVQNSWSGPQFDLPRTVDTEPRLPAQGWLTADAGKRLFTAAGLDLDALRSAANQRGFKPVALDASLSTALATRLKQTQSHNVLARSAEHPSDIQSLMRNSYAVFSSQ